MSKLLANLDHFNDSVYDSPNALEDAAKSQPELYRHRTLELNADLQPLSYWPLSTQPWTQICFWLVKGWQREKEGGKPIIYVLEEYDHLVIRAARRQFNLPSVVAHTSMIPLQKRVALTRFNLLLRDNFTCQYTGKQLPESELNFDHVIPKSRGGRNTWENLVTCSIPINLLKADRTPEEAGLHLIREPYMPSAYEIREKSRAFPPKFLHETWGDYLYWDAELED